MFCDDRRAHATTFLLFLLQSLERTPVPSNASNLLLDELQPTRPYRSVLRQIVRDPANRALIQQVKAAVPAAAPLLAALEL